jgi:hypothetical protein
MHPGSAQAFDHLLLPLRRAEAPNLQNPLRLGLPPQLGALAILTAKGRKRDVCYWWVEHIVRKRQREGWSMV